MDQLKQSQHWLEIVLKKNSPPYLSHYREIAQTNVQIA